MADGSPAVLALSRELKAYYIKRLKLLCTGVSKVNQEELGDQFGTLLKCLKQNMQDDDEAVLFCCWILEELGYRRTNDFRKTAKSMPDYDFRKSYPKVDCMLTVLTFIDNLAKYDYSIVQTHICVLTHQSVDRVQDRPDLVRIMFNENIASVDDISQVLKLAKQFNRGQMFDDFIKRNPQCRVLEETPQMENQLQTNGLGKEKGEGVDYDPQTMYKMAADPRGIALTINNKTFTSSSTRTGTDKDAEELTKLFKDFGFITEQSDNLKSSDMRSKLKEISEIDHSSNDCLVVCILTHGADGILLGTDDNPLSVEKATEYFNGTNCPSLIGKPKVFIIQACRGGKRDPGLKGDPTDSAAPPPPNVDNSIEIDISVRGENTDPTDGGENTIPVEGDIVIAYCTVSGYVGYRYPDGSGSWFIQSFVKLLRELAPTGHHFLDIMTRVNSSVATVESTQGNKEMPESSTRLRKNLYFFNK